MKQFPKVSIVTPIYNGESYLDKYFNSLLNQTLENIEIICVNNVSTDNSLNILEKYALKDNRIKVINNSQNTIAGASNIAIKCAKANYIGFVDQDDWVDVDMYKTLIDNSDNESADMVCSDYYEFFNQNQVKKVIAIPYDIAESTEAIKRNTLVNGGSMLAAIIKKKLIIDNELFYPEGLFFADNAIGAALFLKAAKIKKVNKHFYYYNTGNISQTRNSDNFRYFDRLTTSNMMIENVKRCDLYEDYREEINYLYYKLYYRNSILGSFFKFSKYPNEYINQIKNEFKSREIEIRSNIYFIKRQRNWRDLILWSIGMSTKLGHGLFVAHKIYRRIKKR